MSDQGRLRPASLDVEHSGHRAHASSWWNVVAWVAVLAPLLYSLSRVIWAVGLPLGISSARLDELQVPGSGSISLVLLSLPAVATGLFVYAFILRRVTRLPDGMPGIGGVAVRPWMVVVPLLLPILILLYANALNLVEVFTSIELAGDIAHLPGWSLWAHVMLFFAWWIALVAVTVVYYRQYQEQK